MGERKCLVHNSSGRNEAIDEPHRERFLGGYVSRTEHDVECAATADQPRQSLRASGAGDQA
jgi:hypothetical protein